MAKEENIYKTRFLLRTPVEKKSGKEKAVTKLLIINSEVSQLDKAFLYAVADRMKSNNLYLVVVDKDNHVLRTNNAKDLPAHITKDLVIQKKKDPKNPDNLLILNVKGNETSVPRANVHNLYITKEDYANAVEKLK